MLLLWGNVTVPTNNQEFPLCDHRVNEDNSLLFAYEKAETFGDICLPTGGANRVNEGAGPPWAIKNDFMDNE